MQHDPTRRSRSRPAALVPRLKRSQGRFPPHCRKSHHCFTDVLVEEAISVRPPSSDTPADLQLALPGVPHHGWPFYSHSDLQYLEHGTGPLAAELKRLWRPKGTMKGGTVPERARPRR